MKMNHLILYTQPNCGLCDDAKIQLKLAQDDVELTYKEIDITEDDSLMNEYMLRVPILMQGDIVIQEGNIDFITIIESLR